MDFHCKFCGKIFQHRCNVYTHQKKCKQYTNNDGTLGGTLSGTNQTDINEHSSKNGQDGLIELYNNESHTFSIKSSDPLRSSSIKEDFDGHNKRNTNFLFSDKSIGFEVLYPGLFNRPMREILSINDDIFNEYRSKEDAINSLISAIIQCNPILIIKSLFFSVQYNQYPIILTNGHYRYAYKNEVIDTMNGIAILNILLYKVHNAMIRANIEVISRRINTGELNYLYDNYDIGRVQNNLLKMINKHLIKKIKKDFDRLIEINDYSHPFLLNKIIVFN